MKDRRSARSVPGSPVPRRGSPRFSRALRASGLVALRAPQRARMHIGTRMRLAMPAGRTVRTSGEVAIVSPLHRERMVTARESSQPEARFADEEVPPESGRQPAVYTARGGAHRRALAGARARAHAGGGARAVRALDAIEAGFIEAPRLSVEQAGRARERGDPAGRAETSGRRRATLQRIVDGEPGRAEASTEEFPCGSESSPTRAAQVPFSMRVVINRPRRHLACREGPENERTLAGFARRRRALSWGRVCGTAQTTAASSTSSGETFSPPRLISSLRRPGEPQIAFLVQHALVAGAEPAVA